MALQRQVRKVGGSVAIVIPRDIAEAMGVTERSGVRLSLVGRQLVVEPDDDTIPDEGFRRSFAAVLRKNAPVFKALADYDAGRIPRPKLAR